MNVHGDALCFMVKWRLAVGGWWRLAVGGWWSLGAVLNKEKLGFLKTDLVLWSPRIGPGPLHLTSLTGPGRVLRPRRCQPADMSVGHHSRQDRVFGAVRDGCTAGLIALKVGMVSFRCERPRVQADGWGAESEGVCERGRG